MAHSSPARWLAPLALVAAAIALGAVLKAGLSSSPTDTPPATPAPVTRTGHSGPQKRTTTTTRTQPSGAAKTYTVQPGDFLSDVADKTGVPIERLRELNPGLAANSMHVGQKIRLAP